MIVVLMQGLAGLEGELFDESVYDAARAGGRVDFDDSGLSVTCRNGIRYIYNGASLRDYISGLEPPLKARLAGEAIREPAYLDGSDVVTEARRYFDGAAAELNMYALDKGLAPLDYRGLKIKAMEGPEFIELEDGSMAVILGLYNPENDEISLNRRLAHNMPLLEDVLRHELSHHYQDRKGVIDKYIKQYGERKARPAIEEQAEYMVSEMKKYRPVLDEVYASRN